LLKIHGVAGVNGDPQLCDFLETNYLLEQIESMKELSDFIVQLKRCGTGLGEFIFDKELEEKV
jgi:ferritin heavy chain